MRVTGSWDIVWERNLQLPVTSVRLSTIGDFFVLTGKEIFNLWKKEKLRPSFKSELFYSIDKKLAIPSRKTEFLNGNQLGDITQCEITIDGRFIITLEKDKKTLKIWYNDYRSKDNALERPGTQPAMPGRPSQFQVGHRADVQPMGDEQDSPSNRMLMMQNRARKIQPTNGIRIHSLKDLDGPDESGDDNELNNEDKDQDKSDPLELEYYLLLNHKSVITSFKLLMPDLYEGFKNAMPTVLATITEKGCVFLWYENLMDKNMAFMCAHVFNPAHNEVFHDVAFLDFPPIDPEKYHELREKQSGIFIPETNKIMQIKRMHNKLGVYQNSYDGTTFDWLFLLKKHHIDVYKAEGLRNFPIKNISIALKAEVAFAHKTLPKLHQPMQILRIGLRDFNDKFSFYGINKSFQLVKYRKDLLQKSTKGEWQFRNIVIAKRDIVTDMITHKDYPILLHRTITNELWFYFEEQVGGGLTA